MKDWTPNYGMGTCMDEDYACFIWHDGSPTEAGTVVYSATIDVTADTSFVLDINGSADSRLGSTGVIAHATYGTWGAIAREINRVSGWHCQLRDAHFDGLPDHMNLPTDETSCYQVAVGIRQDTSDDKDLGCGICAYKYHDPPMQPNTQCCLYGFSGQITDTGSPTVTVYDCDDHEGTEEKVHYYALTTATEYRWPLYGPPAKPIYVAKPGHRILVLCEGSESLSKGQISVVGGLRYCG